MGNKQGRVNYTWIAAFLIVTLLLIQSSEAVILVNDCTKMDISGETYVLTSDVDATLSSQWDACFVIDADGIVFDMQNHLVRLSSGPGNNYGVYITKNGYKSVVKNAYIGQFDYGIGAQTSFMLENAKLLKMPVCLDLYSSSDQMRINMKGQISLGCFDYNLRATRFDVDAGSANITSEIVSTAHFYINYGWLRAANLTVINQKNPTYGVYLYSSTSQYSNFTMYKYPGTQGSVDYAFYISNSKDVVAKAGNIISSSHPFYVDSSTNVSIEGLFKDATNGATITSSSASLANLNITNTTSQWTSGVYVYHSTLNATNISFISDYYGITLEGSNASIDGYFSKATNASIILKAGSSLSLEDGFIDKLGTSWEPAVYMVGASYLNAFNLSAGPADYCIYIKDSAADVESSTLRGYINQWTYAIYSINSSVNVSNTYLSHFYGVYAANRTSLNISNTTSRTTNSFIVSSSPAYIEVSNSTLTVSTADVSAFWMNRTNTSLFYSNIITSDYPVSLYESYYNLFYNNYFNNTYPPYIHSSSGTNYWNTTKDCSRQSIIGRCIGGNRWNTFHSYDEDWDGIAEESYSFTGGTDYLPLEVNTPPYNTTIINISDKPNGSIIGSSSVDVNFITYDENNNTLLCTVYVDGEPNASKSVSNATYDTITVNGLLESSHEIYVKCSDGYGENTSDVWTVYIGNTLVEGFAYYDEDVDGNHTGETNLSTQYYFYKDMNGNGVLDAGDRLLSTSSTLSFSGLQGNSYFVAVNTMVNGSWWTPTYGDNFSANFSLLYAPQDIPAPLPCIPDKVYEVDIKSGATYLNVTIPLNLTNEGYTNLYVFTFGEVLPYWIEYMNDTYARVWVRLDMHDYPTVIFYGLTNCSVNRSTIRDTFLWGDDFEDPAYTMSHINQVNYGNGQQGIENGMYWFSGGSNSTTNAGEPIMELVGSFPENYTVMMRAKSVIGDPPTGGAYICARYRDVDYKYEQELSFQGGEALTNKVVGGTWTNLETASLSFSPDPDVFYYLKANITFIGGGNHLDLYISQDPLSYKLYNSVSDGDLKYDGLAVLAYDWDNEFKVYIDDLRVFVPLDERLYTYTISPSSLQPNAVYIPITPLNGNITVRIGLHPALVVNTSDDDLTWDANYSFRGSLRQAMMNNNKIGNLKIVFRMSLNDANHWYGRGDHWKIILSDVLPPVEKNLTVDGFSQPGVIKYRAAPKAGLEEYQIPEFANPLVEINAKDKRATDRGVFYVFNGATLNVSGIAIYNTYASPTKGLPFRAYATTKLYIKDSYVGLRASGAKPGRYTRVRSIGIRVDDNVSLIVDHVHMFGCARDCIRIGDSSSPAEQPWKIIRDTYIEDAGDTATYPDAIAIRARYVKIIHSHIRNSTCTSTDTSRCGSAIELVGATRYFYLVNSTINSTLGEYISIRSARHGEISGNLMFESIYSPHKGIVITKNTTFRTYNISVFNNAILNTTLAIDLAKNLPDGDGPTPNDGGYDNSFGNYAVDYPVIYEYFIDPATGNAIAIGKAFPNAQIHAYDPYPAGNATADSQGNFRLFLSTSNPRVWFTATTERGTSEYANFTAEWSYAYGNLSGFLLLNSSDNILMYSWPTYSYTVFAYDSDYSIDFTKLKPLNGTNDREEADANLSLTYANQSINASFNETTSIKILDKVVENCPAHRTSANFTTALLWLPLGSETEYNGTQPLVFAITSNETKSGLIGFYDYELKFPTSLANQSPTTSTVALSLLLNVQ